MIFRSSLTKTHAIGSRPSFLLSIAQHRLGFLVSTVLPLLILLVLLGCSGLVSGSEVAFFALQPADLRDLEKKSTDADRRVLQLLEKPKELLATILISNNLINVGIVILSSYILSDLFGYIENALYLFLIEVAGITFLILHALL